MFFTFTNKLMYNGCTYVRSACWSFPRGLDTLTFSVDQHIKKTDLLDVCIHRCCQCYGTALAGNYLRNR